MSEERFAFVKMNGAGNDFVMIDDREERFDPLPATVASLCALHRGIGADGLILLRPARGSGAFAMHYFNRDGGEAGMCGNGARCAARFAFDSGIAGRAMEFETGSGLVRAEVLDCRVAIDMGAVIDLRLSLRLEGAETTVHFAVAGVPHAVVLVDDARAVPSGRFLALAASIRHDPAFRPAGVNVNLVSVREPRRLTYRTYERGVEDETLACGTGAVAAAVIASHLGLVEPRLTCETAGGEILEVAFEKTGEGARNCRLTGGAVVTFRGSFSLHDYAAR